MSDDKSANARPDPMQSEISSGPNATSGSFPAVGQFRSGNRLAKYSIVVTTVACFAGILLAISSYLQIGYMNRVRHAWQLVEDAMLSSGDLRDNVDFKD